MPKNRQYYRKTKYPDKVAEPKSLVFVRIFLFCSVGIKIQYFPTAPYFSNLLVQYSPDYIFELFFPLHLYFFHNLQYLGNRYGLNF